MMYKIYYLLVLSWWMGATLSFAQTSPTRTSSVYFAYKQSELNAKAKQKLDQTFALLYHKQVLDYKVTLTGLADSVGNVAANHQLANKRALAVKTYLIAQGVSADKVTVKVLGERPANNEDEHHRNRRVEIVLRWQIRSKPIVSKRPPTKPSKGNIQVFFDSVKQTPQIFVIDNSRDTVLVGKQGTRMLFYAHSFYTSREQATLPITITLREYYTYADMVLANLTTTSGKRLLETGGMLQIRATQGGKTLRLRRGQNVLLSFPTNSLKKDMKAFNGKRGDEGFINWRRNNRGWVLFGRAGGGCIQYKHICWLSRLFSRRLRARYRQQMGRMTEADRLLLAREEQVNRKEIEEGNKDAYIMSTSRLGWINCDAFTRMPNTVRVQVKIPAHHSLKNTRYFLALHQRRSLVVGYQYYQRKLQFIYLPKNEKATLIAIEYKDKQVLVASEEVRIGEIMGKNLKFVPHTIDGAREAIKKLTAFEQQQFNTGR
ncbi:OmpA family protein [uncultured Microscilla sp.]|uniref:OmpA family protein n=1 Tax=uncultured Microscilla sp. TaxID=432653 RepID=UPI0026180D8E|nr:OmpA family protein [uncultured Microscilla sp.]